MEILTKQLLEWPRNLFRLDREMKKKNKDENSVQL